MLEYVDPIGPTLIFENTTCALGLLFSTSGGLPDDVEHVPRATPGLVALLVVG